jgi:GH25 family lysozyme M1 (1,4-beta-N-acetylmuramidase)
LPLTVAIGALGLVAPLASPTVAAVRQPSRWDRSNVGFTHSPRVLRQLAGPARGPGPATAKLPSWRLARALQGVDVASHQHPNGAPIHWLKVAAAKIQFAVVKGTEGGYYHNPYALTDLAKAKAAGLSVIAYAFAIPNGNGASSSPVTQADYLISYLDKGGTPVPPVALDIEYNPYGAQCYGLSKPAMVAWVSRFVAAVQQKTGAYPIIYTPPAWWNACTGGSSRFSQLVLWAPDYVSPAGPSLPGGWRSWAFWQYSSSGRVAGIAAAGNTDLDQLHPGALPLLNPGAQRKTAGSTVALRVRQADPVAGRVASFTATGLPPGVRIGARGLISGRPASPGTYRAKVSASDGKGDSGSSSFTWTVTP